MKRTIKATHLQLTKSFCKVCRISDRLFDTRWQHCLFWLTGTCHSPAFWQVTNKYRGENAKSRLVIIKNDPSTDKSSHWGGSLRGATELHILRCHGCCLDQLLFNFTDTFDAMSNEFIPGPGGTPPLQSRPGFVLISRRSYFGGFLTEINGIYGILYALYLLMFSGRTLNGLFSPEK